MNSSPGAARYDEPAYQDDGTACIPDQQRFAQSQSAAARSLWMLLAAVAGVAAGSALATQFPVGGSLTLILAVLALVGGLLFTWSPCGYSSLSLLRPAGRYSAASVLRWTPTFIAHAIGYAVGALVLGSMLGLAGGIALGALPLEYSAIGLAVLAIAYGVHQFGFLKMPYPQRRAQVPHDARFRFRPSVIGLLYGYALGMNYLTYVQTPMLYIVTGAALASGSVGSAIAIIALFNVGRCLPVAINFLPVTDQGVQAWLARWQERAVEVDGFVLIALGSAALALLLG